MALTWREIEEFSKCMTIEVYDKISMEAKLHGAKLRRPANMPKRSRIIPKNAGLNDEKIDKMSQDLFNRMKAEANAAKK